MLPRPTTFEGQHIVIKADTKADGQIQPGTTIKLSGTLLPAAIRLAVELTEGKTTSPQRGPCTPEERGALRLEDVCDLPEGSSLVLSLGRLHRIAEKRNVISERLIVITPSRIILEDEETRIGGSRDQARPFRTPGDSAQGGSCDQARRESPEALRRQTADEIRLDASRDLVRPRLVDQLAEPLHVGRAAGAAGVALVGGDVADGELEVRLAEGSPGPRARRCNGSLATSGRTSGSRSTCSITARCSAGMNRRMSARWLVSIDGRCGTFRTPRSWESRCSGRPVSPRKFSGVASTPS